MDGGSIFRGLLIIGHMQTDSQLDHYFSSLHDYPNRSEYILSPLKRMRPTREPRAGHSSRPPEKTSRPAIVHTGWVLGYSRPNKPPGRPQLSTIRRPQLVASGHRLNLISASKGELTPPIDALLASTKSAVGTFGDQPALHIYLHSPMTGSTTAYPQSIPGAVARDRQARVDYSDPDAATAFHRSNNRLNSLIRSLSSTRFWSDRDGASFLDVAHVIAHRLKAGVIIAARGLETMLNEVLCFFLPLAAFRAPDRSDLLTHLIAARPVPISRGLRHAAKRAALATKIVTGGTNGAFDRMPTFTYEPSRTPESSGTRNTVPPLTVNYSPNVTIHTQDMTEDDSLNRRVMELLERHGRELHRILERDLVRRQRTEF